MPTKDQELAIWLLSQVVDGRLTPTQVKAATEALFGAESRRLALPLVMDRLAGDARPPVAALREQLWSVQLNDALTAGERWRIGARAPQASCSSLLGLPEVTPVGWPSPTLATARIRAWLAVTRLRVALTAAAAGDAAATVGVSAALAAALPVLASAAQTLADDLAPHADLGLALPTAGAAGALPADLAAVVNAASAARRAAASEAVRALPVPLLPCLGELDADAVMAEIRQRAAAVNLRPEQRLALLDTVLAWPSARAAEVLRELCDTPALRERAMLVLMLRVGRAQCRDWNGWQSFLTEQSAAWAAHATALAELADLYPAAHLNLLAALQPALLPSSAGPLLARVLHLEVAGASPAALHAQALGLLPAAGISTALQGQFARVWAAVQLVDREAAAGLAASLPIDRNVPMAVQRRAPADAAAGTESAEAVAQSAPAAAGRVVIAVNPRSAAQPLGVPLSPRPAPAAIEPSGFQLWLGQMQRFLADNWYLVAGLLMVVFGATLITWFSWDQRLLRYTLMPTLLGGSALGLAALAGVLQRRDATLRATAAILRLGAFGLLPITALTVPLLARDPGVSGALKPALLAGLVPVLLGVFALGLWRWCRAESDRFGWTLPLALTSLNAVPMVAAFGMLGGGTRTEWLLPAALYLGFAGVAVAVHRVVVHGSLLPLDPPAAEPTLNGDSSPSLSVAPPIGTAFEGRWFFALSLIISGLEVLVATPLAVGNLPSVGAMALLPIGVGSLVLLAEGARRRRQATEPGLDGSSFAGFALILLGLTMGVAYPGARLLTLLAAGALWLWQAEARPGRLHHWLGLSLLALGGGAVGWLDGFPRGQLAAGGGQLPNALPFLGLALALAFSGLKPLARRRADDRLLRCLDEFQPLLLIAAATLTVTSQWASRSTPWQSGAVLLATAAAFAWRAHRMQRTALLHAAMGLVALALPYLGCADMTGRQLQGNTLVFGLAVVALLWLAVQALAPSPLLRRTRSTVLWFYGVLGILGMGLRIFFERLEPDTVTPLWKAMDQGGPILLALALVAAAWYARSLMPGVMAAGILAILFPELQAQYAEALEQLGWGSGVGTGVIALVLAAVCLWLQQLPRLKGLAAGDPWFGRPDVGAGDRSTADAGDGEANTESAVPSGSASPSDSAAPGFPWQRRDHSLFTWPMLGTALYLGLKLSVWLAPRLWWTGRADFLTAAGLLALSLAWLIGVAYLRHGRRRYTFPLLVGAWMSLVGASLLTVDLLAARGTLTGVDPTQLYGLAVLLPIVALFGGGLWLHRLTPRLAWLQRQVLVPTGQLTGIVAATLAISVATWLLQGSPWSGLAAASVASLAVLAVGAIVGRSQPLGAAAVVLLVTNLLVMGDASANLWIFDNFGNALLAAPALAWMLLSGLGRPIAPLICGTILFCILGVGVAENENLSGTNTSFLQIIGLPLLVGGLVVHAGLLAIELSKRGPSLHERLKPMLTPLRLATWILALVAAAVAIGPLMVSGVVAITPTPTLWMLTAVLILVVARAESSVLAGTSALALLYLLAVEGLRTLGLVDVSLLVYAVLGTLLLLAGRFGGVIIAVNPVLFRGESPLLPQWRRRHWLPMGLGLALAFMAATGVTGAELLAGSHSPLPGTDLWSVYLAAACCFVLAPRLPLLFVPAGVLTLIAANTLLGWRFERDLLPDGHGLYPNLALAIGFFLTAVQALANTALLRLAGPLLRRLHTDDADLAPDTWAGGSDGHIWRTLTTILEQLVLLRDWLSAWLDAARIGALLLAFFAFIPAHLLLNPGATQTLPVALATLVLGGGGLLMLQPVCWRYGRIAAGTPHPLRLALITAHQGAIVFTALGLAWLIPASRSGTGFFLSLAAPAVVLHLVAEWQAHRESADDVAWTRRHALSAAGMVAFAFVMYGVPYARLFLLTGLDLPGLDQGRHVGGYHIGAAAVIALGLLLFRQETLSRREGLAAAGGVMLLVGTFFGLTAIPGLSPFESVPAAAWSLFALAHVWLALVVDGRPLHRAFTRLGTITAVALADYRRIWNGLLIFGVHALTFVEAVRVFRHEPGADSLQLAPLLLGLASVVAHLAYASRERELAAAAALYTVVALHLDFLPGVDSYLPGRQVIWVVLAVWGGILALRQLPRFRRLPVAPWTLAALGTAALALAHLVYQDPGSLRGLIAFALILGLALLTPVANPRWASVLATFPWVGAVLFTFFAVAGPEALSLDKVARPAPWLAAAIAALVITELATRFAPNPGTALLPSDPDPDPDPAPAPAIPSPAAAPLLARHAVALLTDHGPAVALNALRVGSVLLLPVLLAQLDGALGPQVFALAFLALADVARRWYRLGRELPGFTVQIAWQGSMLALFLLVRHQLQAASNAWQPEYDVWASVLTSFLLAGLRSRIDQTPLHRRLGLLASVLALPVVGLVWVLLHGLGTDLAMAVVGLHSVLFVFHGRGNRQSPFHALAVCSFVAFTFMLFWTRLDIRAVHAYVIPVGLGVLVLLQLFGAQLQPGSRNSIRFMTVLAMVGSASYYAIADDTHPIAFNLTLLLLCLGAMALGSLMRIRIYLVLGFGGLLIDLVSIAAKVAVQFDRGMRLASVGGVLLVLGLGLVAAALWYKTHREQLDMQLDKLRTNIGSWE